jgi:hypothetical protein
MVISHVSVVGVSLNPTAAEEIEANPLRAPTFAPMATLQLPNVGDQGSVIRHHRVWRQQTIRW